MRVWVREREEKTLGDVIVTYSPTRVTDMIHRRDVLLRAVCMTISYKETTSLSSFKF